MPTFDDVRTISMALPEVEEHVTWGTDVNFRVRNKMFVIGGEDATSVSVKASIGVQAELIDLDPETFSSAAYVGRYGWVRVELARVDPPLLEKLLWDAWRSTAAAKLRGLVSD
ncbi:MAG TPA: MmcQ/YjbR family DNA-binding protein [Candidatus Limnocylindrales bacterium]|nr:MmcQ/YjbR family DNA-binding protein [Candidatus Limnocylindrales bacterium]